MACGPKRDSAARARGDLGRFRAGVWLGPERKTVPTGGTLLAARQGGGKGVGPETGRKRRSACGKKLLGCGVKKKKAEMGWAERVGEREKIFHFPKRFKHFQFNFKLKDLNLR